jgi:hypothetical protein
MRRASVRIEEARLRGVQHIPNGALTPNHLSGLHTTLHPRANIRDTKIEPFFDLLL